MLKVGHVKPMLPGQSKGHIGRKPALGRNTINHFTGCPQDSDVSLAKDSNVQQAIRIEGHPVRSLPPWGGIGRDYIAKESARSMQLTIPPCITEYIAGNGFIQIKHAVRTKGDSVGE